ncbi:MAG: YggS family pyridoxal phosphate-dependent enzyme [Spirochaetes bacterium]|nr:YggS family pyridoxal phosphate-dependent enzyme [Spirochaetota bacterium]
MNGDMIKNNLTKIYESIEYIKDRLKIDYKIKLMAVTKTYPPEDVLEAINVGQTLFGENRVLEAYDKFNSELLKNKDHSLHIIGHLQRNKIKKAVEISSTIQSIDKIETLDALEKVCAEKDKKINYLIEVNTSLEPQKYGVLPDDFLQLLDSILKKSYNYCNLRGLMTIGPFTYDKSEIRKAFRLLYKIYDKTKNDYKKNDFNIISMGMSSDYDIAIEEGSTLLRIGSLIFGTRI